jgi:hypothetical protein
VGFAATGAHTLVLAPVWSPASFLQLATTSHNAFLSHDNTAALCQAALASGFPHTTVTPCVWYQSVLVRIAALSNMTVRFVGGVSLPRAFRHLNMLQRAAAAKKKKTSLKLWECEGSGLCMHSSRAPLCKRFFCGLLGREKPLGRRQRPSVSFCANSLIFGFLCGE